jgi:aspartate-semialdehyde dehydrogenase
MEKVQCAVLGATGVVGQHFLRLLADHPFFSLKAVSASEARAGQLLGEVKPLIAEGIPAEFAALVFDPMDMKLLAQKGVKVAFSALPADIAQDVEKAAVENGIYVFSNASAYRMDPSVPIMVPEINAEHLGMAIQQKQSAIAFIITNANCTATGLTLALLPMLSLGFKKLVVSSYQAISGAGYPGVPAMDIYNNVIPYINNEEPKLVSETKKIFGTFDGKKLVHRDWEIYAHCIRVPTLVGHFISVHLELEKETDYDTVAGLCKNFQQKEELVDLPTAPNQPVLFTEDRFRPQPKMDVDAGEPIRARGMAVTIGRLAVEKKIVRFVTLSNNLVRGAAGGSVLNAELAFRQKAI